MERIVISSGFHDVPSIGRVRVTVRRNAKTMRLRWKGGALSVTVPYGASLSKMEAFVAGASDFIEAHRPKPLYRIGQRIETDGLSIAITQSPHISKMVRIAASSKESVCILVASDLDIESASATKLIDKAIRQAAAHFAKRILLPQAMEIASSVGQSPASWHISRGQRTLGLCTSDRKIKLSCLLVFYTPEQRRYVICHELAHLTHMNHSPLFHSLCASYFGGPTDQVRANLKSQKLPLLK